MLTKRKVAEGDITIEEQDAFNEENDLIKAKIINVFIHPENSENIIVTLDFYYSLYGKTQKILNEAGNEIGDKTVYEGKYARETFEYKADISPDTIKSEMLSHWEKVYRIIQENSSSMSMLEGLSI